MAIFQILVDRQNSAVTLALLGELDMAEVDAFEGELRRIEQSHPPLIAIDLSALELIDSYGLSTLLDAEARAREPADASSSCPRATTSCGCSV